MKYGCVVHSLTDFSKSSSCFCAGSRVSVTICCAGSVIAATTAIVIANAHQRRRTACSNFIRGAPWVRDRSGDSTSRGLAAEEGGKVKGKREKAKAEGPRSKGKGKGGRSKG